MNGWQSPPGPEFCGPPLRLCCPKCQSTQIDSKNLARKSGSAIGTMAGGISGVAGVMNGAEIGTMLGWVVGPGGAVLGTLAGALFGGLIAAAAGCALGASLGEVIDDKLLNNYRCLSCQHSFSRPSA